MTEIFLYLGITFGTVSIGTFTGRLMQLKLGEGDKP